MLVRLPDVYTQFRKAVETQSRVRPVFPTPEQLKPLPSGLEEGAIPTAEDLQQTGERLNVLSAQSERFDSYSILCTFSFIFCEIAKMIKLCLHFYHQHKSV